MEFLTPLEDKTVMEKDSVTLICVISKVDKPATWTKGGKTVEQSDRVVITVAGAEHTLTINSSLLDDEDKYTIRIEDKESTCKLTVTGKHIWSVYNIPRLMKSKSPENGNFH